MKQVFNWTIGSFFRTIGRTIAFLVMGGLIYYILTTNGFEFGIRDLFFDKVSASTFKYGYIDNMYNSSGQALPAWPNYLAYNYMQNTNTENDFWFNNSHNDNSHGMTVVKGVNYIHFTVLINPQVDGLTCSIGSSTKQLTGTWTNTSTGEGGSIAPIIYQYNTMECVDDNNTFSVVMRQQGDNFNVGVPCSLYGLTNNANGANYANVSCPVLENTKWVSRITFFKLGTTASVTYGLNRTFYGELPDGTNISAAINQQTQQQQQNHEEMMDDNTTQAESEATDFFEDFDAPDIGGLGAIITAPLNTIRSLLNSSCTNLVLPLPFVNKSLTLPCMNTIYTQHFGAFFTIYQTIILAIIAYRCIRSIFFDIHGFTNPNDDRIEVMDL